MIASEQSGRECGNYGAMYNNSVVHQFILVKKQIADYIVANQWPEAFACLSPMEQRTMVAIAILGRANGAAIAAMCLRERKCIDLLLSKLVDVGLVRTPRTSPTGKLYELVSKEMINYCQATDRAIIWGDAISSVVDEFYYFAARRFETLETLGLIYGNGRYMAQVLKQSVEGDLFSRLAFTTYRRN